MNTEKSLREEYPEAFEEPKMSNKLEAALLEVEAEMAAMDPKIFEKDITESDPKFYRFIKTHAYVEPPPKLKAKVMKRVFGDDNYRHQILRRKVTIKIQELKEFILEHLPGRLELKSDLFKPTATMGMILFLFTIGIITYYFFYHFNKNQPNPVANNNNSVSTPKPTITSIPSPIPNIVANNESNEKANINNNSSVDNTLNKKENDTLAVDKHKTPKIPNYRKPEQPKGIEKENENLAMVHRGPTITDDQADAKTRTKDQGEGTKISLLNLKNVSVEVATELQDKSLEENFKRDLSVAISNSKKWELVSLGKAQAFFRTQASGRDIILVTRSTKEILWKDENYLEKYHKDKNYIESIVLMLTTGK